MFASLGTGRKRVGKHLQAVESQTKTEEMLDQKHTWEANEEGSTETLRELQNMSIWRWYGGEEELKVFACLNEFIKAYKIVVCEIVVCKLRTNGILSKTCNFIRVLYDGCLMSV